MVVTDATASPVRFPDETIERTCMDNLYLYRQYGDDGKVSAQGPESSNSQRRPCLYTFELSGKITKSYYLFKIVNI